MSPDSKRTLPVGLVLAVMVLAACTWGPRADVRIIEIFDTSSTLLNGAAEAPEAVVPDTVLNRTRCIVIVPTDHKISGEMAAASCRDATEHWSMPWLVRFVPAPSEDQTALVFVLTDDAANLLRAGRLDLTGHRTAKAGPVVRKMVTVTDADLNTDAVAYVVKGSKIEAKPLTATIATESHAPIGKEREFGQALMNAITSFFNTITPVGIILHHSAVLPGEEKVTTDLQEMDAFHRARGFDIRCQGHEYHVAYHYLVMPDGSVKKGRPERCEGAHARGYNEYIGIAVVGDFSSTDNPTGAKGETIPTSQQIQAVTELCRSLMAKYDIPLQRVLRHSDVGTTRCPGDRFPFAALLRALQGPA